jgi:hypothetical protein
MIRNLPPTAKVIVNKKSEFKSTSGTLIQSQGLNAQFVFTETNISQPTAKSNTQNVWDRGRFLVPNILLSEQSE